MARERRAGRAWIALAAALCVGAAAPVGAAAAEVESFELPSPLVDTATPGGELPGGRTVPKVNVVLPDDYDPRRSAQMPYQSHSQVRIWRISIA